MSLVTLQDDSLAFARDEFFAADDVADAVLDELADFGSQVILWGELGPAEQQVLNDLQRKLDEAEERRSRAHARFVWESMNYIRYVTKSA